MKRGGEVHTVPVGYHRGWVNKLDGVEVSHHNTKAAAIAAGRVIAIQLKAEHSIHRKDGVITE
jgi:hypothetical protein